MPTGPTSLLNANAIITLDEAYEELKENTTNYDTILARRINGLSETFETLTGWCIASQSLTAFRVDGDRLMNTGYGLTTQTLLIPILPVQSVTKIDIHDGLSDASTSVITDTTAFVLKGLDRHGVSQSGHLQLLSGAYSTGTCNILLDMVVGFTATHPKLAEAKRLLVTQLQYEYKRWQRNEAGLLTTSMPDGSISFAPGSNLLREVSDGLLQMTTPRFA